MHLVGFIIRIFHDDGQGNCPKHVEFYTKNLFEKLVHLFCFIIRIYHDDGQRNCPKHVEFYSKNNFEKLVHLVGFIIKSSEILYLTLNLLLFQ